MYIIYTEDISVCIYIYTYIFSVYRYVYYTEDMYIIPLVSSPSNELIVIDIIIV